MAIGIWRYKTCCRFWPDENEPEMKPVPFISLVYANSTCSKTHNVIVVHMNIDKEEVEKRIVYVILMNNWSSEQLTPESPVDLLAVWEEMEPVSRGNHPTVITCHDGATASGLLAALSFIIEKLKLEQVLDVCLAVRTIRHNRKQFEQFTFLYHAALAYMSGFETYSNFLDRIKQ